MLFLGPLMPDSDNDCKSLSDNLLPIGSKRNPNIKGRSILLPCGLDSLVAAYATAMKIPYTTAVADLLQRGLKERFPEGNLSEGMIQKLAPRLAKSASAIPTNAKLDLRRIRRQELITRLLASTHSLSPTKAQPSNNPSGQENALLGFTQKEAQELLGKSAGQIYPLLRSMEQEGLIQKQGRGPDALYFLIKRDGIPQLPKTDIKKPISSKSGSEKKPALPSFSDAPPLPPGFHPDGARQKKNG